MSFDIMKETMHKINIYTAFMYISASFQALKNIILSQISK